jgi:hypothetical protein
MKTKKQRRINKHYKEREFSESAQNGNQTDRQERRKDMTRQKSQRKQKANNTACWLAG